MMMLSRSIYFVPFAATLVLLLPASGCDRIPLEPVASEPFHCGRDSWITAKTDPTRYIAHAGGEIDGRRYTNSREAMDLSYRKGFRLLEIDLIETSDGILVGAHDWERWRDASGSSAPEPSHGEFKRARLYGMYQSMDLADLDDWFSAHQDAYLVTDKVTDYHALVKGFSHRDRLIVEVFSTKDFRRARQAGIKYPMLSLRSAIANDGEGEVLGFLGNEPVKFVAVASKVVRSNRDLLRQLRRNYVCAYVFTTSDPDYLKSHLGTTVYGAYTDGWDVKAGACTVEDCDTY